MPFIPFSVSVERLERSTNGLKGQLPKNASPIQWPAIFTLVQWTVTKQVHCMGLLKASQYFDYFRRRPMDFLQIGCGKIVAIIGQVIVLLVNIYKTN
jgi:hypothetical protein